MRSVYFLYFATSFVSSRIVLFCFFCSNLSINSLPVKQWVNSKNASEIKSHCEQQQQPKAPKYLFLSFPNMFVIFVGEPKKSIINISDFFFAFPVPAFFLLSHSVLNFVFWHFFRRPSTASMRVWKILVSLRFSPLSSHT